ncbi:hypothetical protein CL176_04300 [Suicoccus acidiformans]|uniref:Uncharacterized protein n=1 Tax=Suicoccus acidiformans TaxID=2036206 RepID=A0A347WJM1_9LACT|nr:hypothetical protein CL176_04300 [Suicoccus acidiformans]
MIEKEGVERFKTMTSDNESEFSTLSNLEHQCEETKISFTHAYAGGRRERMKVIIVFYANSYLKERA